MAKHNLDSAQVIETLTQIREQRPLVHNITNYVAMNSSANALLALGASPIMAHASEELAELAELVQALVINIGTLSGPWIAAMKLAARCAHQRGLPLVLDPVGAGASRIRTRTALELLEETPVSVIRANASEIKALADERARTRGVDSDDESADAIEAGQLLSNRYSCVVSVSGPDDYIIEGSAIVRLSNGNPLMPRVTTLGCAASAITGAAVGVTRDLPLAAAAGMAITGIAGEIAAEHSDGPGTLQWRFLDALYNLGESEIDSRLRWAPV